MNGIAEPRLAVCVFDRFDKFFFGDGKEITRTEGGGKGFETNLAGRRQ